MISVREAARIIRAGGVVAYPTETAYGLGADALNREAVKKVYRIKGRPRRKKMPVIVSSVKELEGHAFLNELGHHLSRHLHPGPLNIVVNSDLPWFGAFRISSSPVASRLAKLAGPITATSANISGKKPAFNPEELEKLGVPVVGGEKLREGPVSTVYDPFTMTVIREGAIPEVKIKRYVVAFNVLKRVKPPEAESRKILKLGKEVLELVKKHHRKTVLGGSIAKGTFTRNVRDIDLFLLFPKGEKLEGKLELLKGIAASFSKQVETSYAQHPYVKARFRGITVELVPAYDTKPPEVLSAADRSRWHVKFVRSLPDWLRDEILMFKQFCDGIGVYGAESRVEGLSSYAMEVLVAKNRGFVKALEKLSRTGWPLRVKDPVDKKRNVTASISEESFALLKEAAKEYLKNPGERFFFPQKPPLLKKLHGLRNKALVVLKKPDLPEDAAWGNAKRRARKLARNARLEGYLVKRWSVLVGKRVLALFEFFPGEKKLIVKGPPVTKKEHARRFKEAHPHWFEENGRLYAEEKRRFESFSELVRHFEDADVLEGDRIEGEYKKMGTEEKLWVSEFLINRKPWEY